jgi:fructose-1-phosphate kinase PfkB-like protein
MFLTVCLNPTLQKTLHFPAVISGTVNRTGVHRLDVSGKGINVTRVLTQIGKKAKHLTQLGGDMKPLFISLCEQDGLSVDWVESDSQIRFCYTLITENDGCVTELVEESEPVSEGTEQRLLEKFETALGGGPSLKCLIISGTKAAGFSDAVIPAMVRKAKEKGLTVILDIKGKDLLESLKYEPDVIKPNLFEFAATFTPDLIKDNDLTITGAAAKDRIKSAVLEMACKYKCRVILTNGSRSIFAADWFAKQAPDNFFEVEIQPVKALNTIGCGDAFTAGLAAALDGGADFNAAINEGIRCGALNAGLVKPGVIG